MSRQINAFQDNPFLDLGRYIQEESYSREKKNIRLNNLEIDLVQRQNGEWIIGEVKKSSRFLESATMQLAFYLFRLEQFGLHLTGELLFPQERKRIKVKLDRELKQKLNEAMEDIQEIIKQEIPPFPEKISWCRHCAYKDFCFS